MTGNEKTGISKNELPLHQLQNHSAAIKMSINILLKERLGTLNQEQKKLLETAREENEKVIRKLKLRGD